MRLLGDESVRLEARLSGRDHGAVVSASYFSPSCRGDIYFEHFQHFRVHNDGLLMHR
jgi:hypothetical protein